MWCNVKPRNITELEAFVLVEWTKIPHIGVGLLIMATAVIVIKGLRHFETAVASKSNILFYTWG